MKCYFGPDFSPRTIGLIGKFNSPEVAEPLGRLAHALDARGIAVLLERQTAEQAALRVDLSRWPTADFDGLGLQADAAIVLGGDGSMLNAARRLVRFQLPLVGVNQGRLGFLTDIGRNDVLLYLDDLLAGRFRPEWRMLLSAEVIRSGEVFATHLALNDVVIDKGAMGRMIELDLIIDGEFIYNLRADGLIVSTPTGSTAYSMSAGGPIVHPTAQGIALVPLSPHSLTNRPILVSEEATIEIRVATSADPRVHFDGQVPLDLQRGDLVRLRRNADKVLLLHPPGYSYFAMLRQKLHWSEHPRGR